MEVDQGVQQVEAAAEHSEEPAVTKQVDQPTQIYMECLLVEVEKQAESADPGKFMMQLKDLKVLPVVRKDPKAQLVKIGGKKKRGVAR